MDINNNFFQNKFNINNDVYILNNDDDYTENFGKQWKKYTNIQIDSINNFKVSYNLLNELLYSFYFYSKKKKNNRNIKSIVFGTYPNNWIFKNNVISYRYTGPHFQFKDKSEKYIVSLTRCNQEKSKNFFKNLKYFSLLNKYNILPMESCTNPYDVFKSYFFFINKN